MERDDRKWFGVPNGIAEIQFSRKIEYMWEKSFFIIEQ